VIQRTEFTIQPVRRLTMRPALLAVLMWLAVPGQGRAAELAAADKDAIRELLVRHYLKGWRQDQLFFLAFDRDTDPPDAFLKRFADLKMRIRKGSKAKIVDPDNSGSQVVFDKDTNEPGVLIKVRGLKPIDADKAEVKGSVFRGRLWGYGGTFIVEKADSRWKILEEASHWEA
jgi:hypothetical protein